MSMAADSNMNFFQHGGVHGGVFPPSFYNQHVVSFQSGAVNSGAGMDLSGGGLIFGGDCGNLGVGTSSATMFPGFESYGSLIMEPLPGLKHDTGLAVDWSFHEQAILNDGLIKFADEPGMLKYIKLAALLPDKTVRDVALRCRWMAKRENVKRRKLSENYAAKKIQSRKENIVDSSTNANIHSIPPDNMAAYSFMLQHANHNHQFSYEVPTIDGATQRLLDENNQVLNQISANLSAFKLQDNIELFSRTTNNIRSILNSMSQTPGMMSQMPPLPVSVNDDIMNSILPIASQASTYGMHSGTSLKQEPI